jgi:hypothetical protein
MHQGDRVERVELDVATLPLTPEDFFLLSRIEGKPTVEEVIRSSGLPASEAKQKLARLIEIGAVRSHSVKIELKRSQSRRRNDRLARRLSATMEAGREKRSAAPKPAPSREQSLPKEEPPPLDPNASIPAEIEFELVPADDSRIDPELAIDVDRQRDIVSALDRLETMNHFEVLRIMPTSNTAAIKRAYHKLSRHLHPDAYYGKDIGPYRDWLSTVFEAVKTSYDLLMSSDKRDEYVQRLLEIEAHKRAQTQARVAAVREAEEAREAEVERQREMAEALEREREEAEARRKREAEREAWRREQEGRKARDRARKMRVDARLLGADTRKAKAKAHVKQARAELAAGNEGAAAGLMRLAMDLDPSNEEYHRMWQDQLAHAQESRSDSARAKGDHLANGGDLAGAAHYYETAARAHPTPFNLARAAHALAAAEDERSHMRAMAALDALQAAEALGEPLPPDDAVAVLCELAEGFLRLGQPATAKVQLDRAAEQIPSDKRVQALLKRVKVT